VRALAFLPLLAVCGCGLSIQSAADLAALAMAGEQCGLDIDQADQAGETLAQIVAGAVGDPACQAAGGDIAKLVTDLLATSSSTSKAALEARSAVLRARK
jgi:hypothetical protein